MRRVGLLLLLATAACYDAGPYGYQRHYVPLREERPFLQRSSDLVYNEVRNDPEDFRSSLASWFGVVEAIQGRPDGLADIRLGFRTHQDRHLCADQERETCRVTVSQASTGPFTARVRLRPEDTAGRNRVAPESLMRVYCSVTGEYDDEGGPLLACDYYRHWPRGQWAHTGMRDGMRR